MIPFPTPRLRTIALVTFSFALLVPLTAQEDASTRPARPATPESGGDEAFRTAYAEWQAKYDALNAARTAAREAGKLTKGGVAPAELQEAERAADAVRDAVVAKFGKREDLSAESYRLFATMHERSRDYKSAVRSYEQSLQKGDPKQPNLRTLNSLCIAAMNSKDDTVAAKWMRATIAAEDEGGSSRRNLAVRTSYYPRTLIALGDWERLDKHLATLAADEAPACHAAAATFGVVSSIHRGDLKAARTHLDAIRAAPAEYPDHQCWAVLAQLALLVNDGRFDAGAKTVREFLASGTRGSGSAVDKNQRRYLAAIEPFLGKPAPALRSDHCVGGSLTGADVLPGLHGKVVVLDFWQPWCEPCRKAMPEMVEATTRYGEKLQLLGVCRVENWGYDVSERKAVRPLAPADYPAHVEDFRKDMALNYPLVICDTMANSSAYRIAGVPTLVIIDREGIVRYMSCGAGEPGLFRLALAGVVGAK